MGGESATYLYTNVDVLFVPNKLDILLSKKLENKVYKTIKELHNYEIPEISTIQASNVDKDYEKWLEDFVEQ